MSKLINDFKSYRFRLFISLCIVVTVVIMFLIVINNIVLETVYIYAKTQKVNAAYQIINSYYLEKKDNLDIEEELNRISAKNDFKILILNSKDEVIYSSDKNLLNSINRLNQFVINNNSSKVNFGLVTGDNELLYKNDKVTIRKIVDSRNSFNYLLLTAELDDGNTLYIRIQIEAIQESVRISNDLLLLIGGISLVLTSFFALFTSRKFTKPIVELDEITKSMAKLEFNKKYAEKGYNNEIDELGRNINIMSDKLERTIKQLRATNVELEKDIEEKSKIDEMRKQFISDVSHELKTPIALIQGYAEGLLENVNTDEESRKFYAEVILDESNKMDKLVKQLLELMKLEYGIREFNNTEFDIVELIKEVIRKCEVMIEENNIEVQFNEENKNIVFADPFYIDQIITNYFTNAIKHAKEINDKKVIKIELEDKKDKIRVNVFNTGKNINEDDLERVWKRFYKLDESRNREDGGTGIGLSLVKAIMNNYGNKFGAINKEDGVEFFFELDKKE